MGRIKNANKPAILAIEANDPGDRFTRDAYRYRREHVYPELEQRGFRLKRLCGSEVTREKVLKVMAKRRYRFVIMTGHGLRDRYKGFDARDVLRVGDYRSDDPRKKFFHLVSCHAGYELGPDLVDNGCYAFFGYKDLFQYNAKWSQEDLRVLFECDAAIDFAVVKGWSARKIYKRVRAKYRRGVRKLERRGSMMRASELERTMDQFVVLPSGPGSRPRFR